MKVQVKHGYKDGIKLYTGLYKERGYIRIDDAESDKKPPPMVEKRRG